MNENRPHIFDLWDQWERENPISYGVAYWEGHAIRWKKIGPNIYWVLRDACDALEIKKVWNVSQRVPEYEQGKSDMPSVEVLCGSCNSGITSRARKTHSTFMMTKNFGMAKSGLSLECSQTEM